MICRKNAFLIAFADLSGSNDVIIWSGGCTLVIRVLNEGSIQNPTVTAEHVRRATSMYGPALESINGYKYPPRSHRQAYKLCISVTPWWIFVTIDGF